MEEERSCIIVLEERQTLLVLFGVESVVHDGAGGWVCESVEVPRDPLTPPCVPVGPGADGGVVELLNALVHALDDILLNRQQRDIIPFCWEANENVARVLYVVVVIYLDSAAEQSAENADVYGQGPREGAEDVQPLLDGVVDPVDDFAVPRSCLPRSWHLVQSCGHRSLSMCAGPDVAAGRFVCTDRKSPSPQRACESLTCPPVDEVKADRRQNVDRGAEHRDCNSERC